MNRQHLLQLCCFAMLSLSCLSAYAYDEKIYVQKVISDDKLAVERRNGDVYLLKVGLGCRSIMYYDHRHAYVTSSSPPAFGFIDASSHLTLQKHNENCIIWSADKIN